MYFYRIQRSLLKLGTPDDFELDGDAGYLEYNLGGTSTTSIGPIGRGFSLRLGLTTGCWMRFTFEDVHILDSETDVGVCWGVSVSVFDVDFLSVGMYGLPTNRPTLNHPCRTRKDPAMF